MLYSWVMKIWLLLLFLWTQSSWAFSNLAIPASLLVFQSNIQLVNGTTSSQYPGVIQLLDPDGNICTGVIVGTHPTTVITAGHCLLDETTLFLEQKPSASYSTYTAGATENLDIAVLTYETVHPVLSENQIFSVSPQNLKLGDVIELCGFGDTSSSDHTRSVSNNLQCGRNVLAAANGHFTAITQVQKPFSEIERSLVASKLSQWGSQPFFLASTIAKGSILGPDYDKMVTINGGDSGGPWFTENSNGVFLAGISTIGSHFSEAGSPFDQFLFISAALNLHSADARTILATAATHIGADIKGLNDLLQSP
jgi:hypothetical protein